MSAVRCAACGKPEEDERSLHADPLDCVEWLRGIVQLTCKVSAFGLFEPGESEPPDEPDEMEAAKAELTEALNEVPYPFPVTR